MHKNLNRMISKCKVLICGFLLYVSSFPSRLETDILFGKRNGMKTLAVLSGVVSIQEIEGIQQQDKNSELLPDFYADSVKSLLECLDITK